MFFEWAFPVLRGGGRVRQEDWPTSDYWFIRDGRIWRHTALCDVRVDEVGACWIVNTDDWVLWEPPVKQKPEKSEPPGPWWQLHVWFKCRKCGRVHVVHPSATDRPDEVVGRKIQVDVLLLPYCEECGESY